MVESSEITENTAKPNESSETAASPILTLEILKVIKDAQQQHGLRHSDYQRYRGYCTRRIRRLRKVLHIPQGDKRHFKRRDVTEEKVKDESAMKQQVEELSPTISKKGLRKHVVLRTLFKAK